MWGGTVMEKIKQKRWNYYKCESTVAWKQIAEEESPFMIKIRKWIQESRDYCQLLMVICIFWNHYALLLKLICDISFHSANCQSIWANETIVYISIYDSIWELVKEQPISWNCFINVTEYLQQDTLPTGLQISSTLLAIKWNLNAVNESHEIATMKRHDQTMSFQKT